MKIRRMCFARWISLGYRHTLRIYNTYCFSTSTVVTRTRLNVTFTRTLSVLLYPAMSIYRVIQEESALLFCLESLILSFPKVVQIPPESPCMY